MSDMISRRTCADPPVKLRIALVTAEAARDLDPDLSPLMTALRGAGAEVAAPSWDDPTVDWSHFDAAVLRSTWDYTDRIDEFLDWCARCAARTRLLNRPEVVRWNTDKHYLVDLARAGVPVVPTRFIEPDDDVADELAAFLTDGRVSVGTAVPAGVAEFVVKPAVGAGSRDAARYRRADASTAAAHVTRLIAAGRSVMLQPYLGRVDHEGETAVLYLGGEYSHTIRKGPLLQAGAAFVEGLFAEEDIRPREPSRAELELAAAAYAAIPFDPPVYARIDLLQDAEGRSVVLELELTEPSLFFPHAPGAANRFARRLVQVAATNR